MPEQSDILRAAIKEEADLVRQLEASPVFRKLQAVRDVIAAYTPDAAMNMAPAAPAKTTSPARRRRPRVIKQAKGTTIEETADAAEKVIRELGRPVPRGELYEKLTANGLVIKGKNPKNALATRLYHSGRFRSIEGKGYVLKSTGATKESETADGDTPDSDPSAVSNRARPDQPGNPAHIRGQPNGGG